MKTAKMINLPPSVFYYKGKTTGPTVVIIGATHGNELNGVTIIESLKTKLENLKIHGDLYLIIGNPKALQEKKRFINTDLNRLFTKDFDSVISNTSTENLNYEQQRALELSLIFKKADFVLDIHSTIKKSVPFVYCDLSEKHHELATLFSPEYIVSANPKLISDSLNSSIDNYVDRSGGIGLTLETGWHKDHSNLEVLIDRTIDYLIHIGTIPKSSPLKPKTIKAPTALEIYTEIIANSDIFNFKNEYKNFDQIEADSIFAIDVNENLSAKYNSYIIFPKINITQGSTACYLAKKTNLTILK